MKYLRPRLPEKEIELCLDLFDKQEAKKRILKYIEGVLDDAESQLKNCFIHDAVKEQDSAIKTCKCEMPAKIHGKNLCWRCKRPLS